MRAALERRVQALESVGYSEPLELYAGRLGTLHLAMFIGLALRRGGCAKAELDAAGTSLEPERRVKLTKTLERARVIGKLLAKYRPNNETPLSARGCPPERLGVLLGASRQAGFSSPVLAHLPADPPLPAEEIEVIEPTEEERSWDQQ